MQNYTTCITGWLQTNFLWIIKRQTTYVIFRPYQKKLNYDPQVNIFDNESNKKVTLERKNFIKYLRLLIDENLSWKTHIHSVARHIVPTCTLLNINQSNKRPRNTFFVNAKILPLQSLYYEFVCSLMYDANKNTAPDNILKHFSRISSVHT